jgi:hypothetical protein
MPDDAPLHALPGCFELAEYRVMIVPRAVSG